VASGITIPVSQRLKDKDETRAFTIDWSKALATGDTISGAPAWTLPGGIASAQQSNTTTTSTIWISGGTVGTRYIVKCRITTTLSLSHAEEQAFELTIIDESAQTTDHYCSLDDVNKLVPQVPFTDTSKPPAAVVVQFIESVAKRIDASIANIGYVVPVVSGANALELLREACAWGALGLAQHVRDTAVKTAVTDAGRPMKNLWTQLYDDWLKHLTNPQDPFELADAPRTNEQLLKQGDSVLRSFVETIGSEDDTFDVSNPIVQRSQVL
jgi:hypothetical protein